MRRHGATTTRRTARTATSLGLLAALALPLNSVDTASAGPADAPWNTDTVRNTDALRDADAPRDADTVTAADAGASRAAGRTAARVAARGLVWERCPAAERLPPPVECATVHVPLDYTDPDGESLPLRVSRVTATGPSEERRGSLVFNPGGPGGDGTAFPLRPLNLPERVWRELREGYDLVGYAPRGVGGTAPLSCAAPESFRAAPSPAPTHPSRAEQDGMHEEAARYAAGCALSAPRLLPHLTSGDNARDLHVLRAALGEERLNYLGVSYGSYLGAVYASRFPESVGAMVLDSVVHPGADRVWYRGNLLQSEAFEERWADFRAWVARHDAVYGLGDSADRVARRYDQARQAVADPVPGQAASGTRVGRGELHRAYLGAVYDDASWPRLAHALAEFHRGRPEPLRAVAQPDPRDAAERENTAAVYTAVQCNDAPSPRDPARWRRDVERTAERAPFAAWENARQNLPCAHWPLPAGTPAEVGAAEGALPPVLLVQGTRDAPTPFAGAVETQRRLPGSVLVTEEGGGRHGVTGGNSCVDRLVAGYLLRDDLPSGAGTSCPARPEPRPSPDRATGG
ncbi:alpha/beta hydrolase [Streptomyces sp. SM14]|uniref:alpha/beta hydrolase n=2 Tax=unclassified Streptomyces TaxID=2593676 RepID=UPI000CD53DAF|nr:alpha/beta hydrolase [Streptomyces sp. SM14]